MTGKRLTQLFTINRPKYDVKLLILSYRGTLMAQITGPQLVALFYTIMHLERQGLEGSLKEDLLHLKQFYRSAARDMKQKVEGSMDSWTLHHMDELTNECSIYGGPLVR